jgi:hypothetical protein
VHFLLFVNITTERSGDERERYVGVVASSISVQRHHMVAKQVQLVHVEHRKVIQVGALPVGFPVNVAGR